MAGQRWEILGMGARLGTDQFQVALTSMSHVRKNLLFCYEK